MKNNLLLLFVLVSQISIAQTNAEKLITGIIVANTTKLEGISVVNSSNNVTTISNSYGQFSILVKEGDILSFSAVNYESLRKIINKEIVTVGNITVNLIPKNIELEEVIINQNSNITAENLGIIPKNQVKLTPAERKLYSATQGIDAVFNYFSGRTEMLKKELKVEQKEFLIVKLENLFEDKYYIETLKIPKELIKGFQYYCVEDVAFSQSLNDKKKTMSMFLIVGLASEFNKKQLVEGK